MNSLKAKVMKTIDDNKLIEDGDKIVLAVSGGPDSICMLNIMYEIIKQDFSQKLKNQSKHDDFESAPKIVVAHVNHMIREEAKEDEEFVRKFCEKLGVEFFSKSIDVKKLANNNKIGLEETGRIARYNFFDEVMELTHASKIAIAHNKNDKIETIIMNMLRGSGSYGLQGIQAKNGKYIRPLIDCNRVEIEEYCKENNIDARIDKTNFDNIYTRNKIRNVVIPYIKKEFNPNIIDTISRLSDLIKEENEYIDNQVRKTFDEIKISESISDNTYNISNNSKDNGLLQVKDNNKIVEISLNLKKFNLQDKVIKSRLVLYTITRLFGTSKGIEKIHIEDILKLCENNIGNKYLTPNKHTKILVKGRKSVL